jgi:N-acylneuraminate cytidylyltransferase
MTINHYQSQKNLCIIPARGGSKRIPRKNVKDFLGKPIIAYSIETALESNLFDEVMVSTDDDEIAEIAKNYGAKVPFMRSEENADDFATTADVLIEVITNYQKLNKYFNIACCMYPTAPLIKQEYLKKSYDLLIEKKFDSVFPIVKFSYPIFRALKIEDNKTRMIWEENLKKRSQDLPEAFHDAGQFYWFDVKKLLSNNILFSENAGAIEIAETEVQDIDNETDWKIAEIKYKLLN